MKVFNLVTILFFFVAFYNSSLFAEEPEETPFNLGEKSQIKNTLVKLINVQDTEKRKRFIEKINESIISNESSFGGPCDLYELPYTAFDYEEKRKDIGYDGAQFFTKVLDGFEDSLCLNFDSLTAQLFMKSAGRASYIMSFCYDLFHDEADAYGAQEQIKRIFCNGDTCPEPEQISVSNVLNLYKHFFPYRFSSLELMGTLDDWGVQGKSIDEAIKILGTAFCIDPNWSHF